MPASDLDVVRDVVAAFNARDLDSLVEMITEDAEFTSRLVLLDGRRYRGAEGIRRYVDDIESAFADWRTEGNELLPAPGGRVLHLSRIVARSRAGGVPIEQPTGIIYTVRDGLVAHAEVHLDIARARAAAGLAS